MAVEQKEIPESGPKRADVLKQIEGDFFLDYAIFTGAIREYVARTLEEQYGQNENDWHRRLFLIAVYREEYTAYEDLGALLEAFLKGCDEGGVPLDVLISYRPSRVVLRDLFERYKIASGTDLFDRLSLKTWIPDGWSKRYERIDLEKCLRTACAFFVDDCAKNQKDSGVLAFNKVKHGLLVVPSATRYIQALPDVPAAVHVSDSEHPDAKTNPITVQAIPHEQEKIAERLRAIHFIQIDTRLLALLYAIRRWPERVKARGFAEPLDAFGHPNLRDLDEVCTALTAKGKTASS